MAHVKSEQESDSNVTEKGISGFVLRPRSLENVEVKAEAEAEEFRLYSTRDRTRLINTHTSQQIVRDGKLLLFLTKSLDLDS
ncbi:hypothetical protein L1987_09077 [Smallanthus sonchifolius]|uniref:Uncharacterized protein n=1 Tax=Smallanthus sonchifolius TaxID=185202 RepID=A0ACB9JMX9_9ASTR|nr:hypothetical protein L1987_09077 [Smallanthus sonchifolius]